MSTTKACLKGRGHPQIPPPLSKKRKNTFSKKDLYNVFHDGDFGRFGLYRKKEEKEQEEEKGTGNLGAFKLGVRIGSILGKLIFICLIVTRLGVRIVSIWGETHFQFFFTSF